MRIWTGIVAAVMLTAPALAQQAAPGPSPSPREANLRLTTLDKPGCKGGLSPAVGPAVKDASERIKANDFTGARPLINQAAAAATTTPEHVAVASIELMLALGTKDPTRLLAVWEPVLASGCFSDDDVAKAREFFALAIEKLPQSN